MKRRGLVIAAAVAACLTVAWLQAPEPGARSPAETGTTAMSDPASPPGPLAQGNGSSMVIQAGAARASPAIRSLPELPPSLADVEIDGAIRFGPDGRLQPDRDLRRLFDFMLTTLGEQGLSDIRLQLGQFALATGDDAGAQAVLDAFDRYLGYLRAAGSIDASDPGALLAALTELRRDWLGVAAAEAFFGDEEAYARATLAREAVLGDPTLAAGQREERLAAIDATLDPRLVESRERALAHLDVVAENRVFDALEVDAPIRLEQRTVQYGADAADRLATLDAERADWSARSERYFAERERIQASTRLTGAEADAAIAALEAAFTESERRRLAALGRIRASGH